MDAVSSGTQTPGYPKKQPTEECTFGNGAGVRFVALGWEDMLLMGSPQPERQPDPCAGCGDRCWPSDDVQLLASVTPSVTQPLALHVKARCEREHERSAPTFQSFATTPAIMSSLTWV